MVLIYWEQNPAAICWQIRSNMAIALIHLILSISENITAHQNLQLPTNPEVKTIRSLALYITERRLQYPTISESYAHDFEEKVVESQHHSFKIEKFADLQSRPYSIAPLPDGRILVTESLADFPIVSVDGSQGALISPVTRSLSRNICNSMGHCKLGTNAGGCSASKL